MTSSFSGSYKPGKSVESRTLDQLDPSKQSFVNRDFVKNIAWLNQSVGTLSKFTQTLQKGVDSANQDIFGVINDLISEITILFAGGQPTGFEWGDLQYIFQAWGAMLGINPGTPFPLNLVQAMEYMFTTWIAPTEQFTDAIFDAQNAWAEELGLSQDFLDALHAYQHAIEALNLANTDAFYQGIHELLDLFQPQDEASQQFWQSILDLFEGDPLNLKPIFAELADLGIPFINALTNITNNLNAFLHPADVISAGQIQQLSANIVPVPSSNTATWDVGSNNIYAWVYDNAKEAFTTLGTGIPKRVLTVKKFTCIPNQTLVCDALVEWDGVPSGQTGFGIQVAFFQGNTEKLNYTINIPSGHAPTASNIALHQELVVPQNVDGMKIGAYVDNTITQGQVWIKNLSVKISGLINISWVAQLRDELNNLMPLDVWWNALQVPVGNQEAIERWIKDVLTPESWLDAGKLFGSLPGNLIDWVPISSLVQDSSNFLADPKFSAAEGIDGKGIYTWDGTQGYSGYGSVKTSGDGTEKALLTKDKTSAVKNNQITVGAMIKWSMLAISGASGAKFAIDIILYNGNKKLETVRIAHMDTPTQNSNWVYIGNTYLIDNPDTTAYRVRLVVTDQVTSGQIWWDDVINQKVQLIALDWIDGAVDWLTSLGDQINKLLQDSLTALNGLFDPNGDTWSWIEDLSDALNDMWTDAQYAIAGARDAWDNSELGKSLANAAHRFAEDVDSARVIAEQWLKNLFEDATILLDFLHLSYPVGHSYDAPDHTELFQGVQKRTYWAAWNRQMIGLGWAQNKSAPTLPAPTIGDQVTQIDNTTQEIADTIAGAAGRVAPRAPKGLYAIVAPSGSTSVPNGFLYYIVTALDSSGNESLASNEAFVFVLFGPAQVNLYWQSVTGAVSYRIYRGNSPKAQNILLATVSGVSYIDRRGADPAPVQAPPNSMSAIKTSVGVITNKTTNLTTLGKLPAAAVDGEFAQSKITGLTTDLDNAIIGSGISVGRTLTSTTNIAWLTTGNFGFAPGFFNAAPTWKTNDINWGAVTIGSTQFSAVQVTRAGFYVCEISLDTAEDQGARFGIGVAVGGYSTIITSTIMSGNTFTPIYRLQGAVTVYVPANQFILPCLVVLSNTNTAGITFKGESTGLVTRFSVTRTGGPR